MDHTHPLHNKLQVTRLQEYDSFTNLYGRGYGTFLHQLSI